jgi:hypothetical protein
VRYNESGGKGGHLLAESPVGRQGEGRKFHYASCSLIARTEHDQLKDHPIRIKTPSINRLTTEETRNQTDAPYRTQESSGFRVL